MGNAPSLPGLGGGRAHGMRYDDPGGSPKGHRPEGIPAVAMEIQTAEQIEEESIGGDSEVEVLEPLESHSTSTIWCVRYRRDHEMITLRLVVDITCAFSRRLQRIGLYFIYQQQQPSHCLLQCCCYRNSQYFAIFFGFSSYQASENFRQRPSGECGLNCTS